MRMEAGRLLKRGEAMKQPGHKKRGRSQLRWEDYINRDIRKAGGG